MEVSNLLYAMVNWCAFRSHIGTAARLSHYNFSELKTTMNKIYTWGSSKFTLYNGISLCIQATHQDTRQIVPLQF